MYHTLVQSSGGNVKQILSLSLHEVARLLHEAGVSVDDELLPVFEDMIQVLLLHEFNMLDIIILLCYLGCGDY